MANPHKAVAAVMPLTIDCDEGVAVAPMTLAMWAALERIDSPLITGKPAKDTMELLPSLYLLTHGAAEILSGNLLTKAMTWADTVSPMVLSRIQAACYEQMSVVTAVIPDATGKKKHQTDGSPHSLTTSQRSTTGALKKSSTASRSQRSHSSTDKKR